MMRGDLARIKIATDKLKIIDSSMAIMVIGKKFVIKVIEEVGEVVDGELRCCGGCVGWREGVSSRGSVDGGSVMAVAVGSSEDGSDGDWSYNGQMLLGVESQGGRKGQHDDTRLLEVQANVVSELDPILLGKSLGNKTTRVNSVIAEKLAVCDVIRGVQESDRDVAQKVVGRLDDVLSTSFNRLLKTAGGENIEVGSGNKGINNCDRDEGGRTTRLRTRTGDIPVDGLSGKYWASPTHKGDEVGTSQQVDVATTSTSDRCRKTKAKKKQSLTHHGCRFLNFQDYIQRKGRAMMKRKASKPRRRRDMGQAVSSVESDLIQNSAGK
ncbi:hypothetical protein A2U01_0013596, partial [Trifolium medium]|nr:hypothetical protein [Trifolium medium]